jgi:hypothetical protein
MLSRYDETLVHQAPVTFDQTHISDHRFFDRVWFGGFGKDGVRFMCGMAVYKNTNTVDGFFVISRGDKQYNLRLSRPMFPNAADMAIGPLTIDVVEPFKELTIALQPVPDHGFSADLRFFATTAAHQENPHIKRADGRLVQDYTRFDQVGKLTGWIDSASGRVQVRDWFCARDHSWGFRPGVGGYEPTTSGAQSSGNPDDVGPETDGFLLVSLMFDSPHYSGFVHVQENGAGRSLYLDGTCYSRVNDERRPLPVLRVEHDLTFIPRTRTCSHGNIRLTLLDGTQLAIEARSLLPTWCFKGTGYDFGYNDERGLGVFRGNLLESDVYDVSHAEDVRLPDGRTIRPWHREGDALLQINGESGAAHFAVISSGRIPRYGLDGAMSNRST